MIVWTFIKQNSQTPGIYVFMVKWRNDFILAQVHQTVFEDDEYHKYFGLIIIIYILIFYFILLFLGEGFYISIHLLFVKYDFI